MRASIRKRTPPRVESLEKRQLMSGVFQLVPLNTELIVNGNAEADTGAANNTTIVQPSGGWVLSLTKPNFTVVKYGASGGLPDTNTPGPADKGNNFFAGGPNTSDSTASQGFDVQALAAGIDAGVIKANLSAWLGGWATEDDHMNVTLRFFDAVEGNLIDAVALKPVLAADRNNATSLIQRVRSVKIPAGTRWLSVELEAIRTSFTYDDGYADDISLKFTTTSKTGFVSGDVFNDADGDTMHDGSEKGVKGITIYVDKNDNGKLDKGELNTKTDRHGEYTLAGVPQGIARVREVVPAGFRQNLAPVSTSVLPGLTMFYPSFGITQTSRIIGAVFNDANANSLFDPKEKGAADITVYLDFNDNGQLDAFELKTTTSSDGFFNFTIPFGSYILRVAQPKGYRVTNNLNGRQLTVARGSQVDAGDFGVRKV